MPEYSYIALGNTGSRSQGTLTANSEREVMTMLDARGMFPLRIEPASTVQVVRGGGKRVRGRHMSVFYGQLSDLLRAGVPLLKSLEILERQSSVPALAATLREIRAKVADGTSLADSMALFPKAFNELSVSMVRAGQEGGFLEDVLERIAKFTEHQEDLKAKVVGALAYPIFLAVAGAIVLNVLVIWFVPMFESVFERLRERGEMPSLTLAIISVSQSMRHPLFWIAIVGGGIGLWMLYRKWTRTEQGRLTVDGWKLRLPTAGRIYLNLSLARFTRILGTLLHNGIPILQALKIAKDATGNRVLTKAIDQAAENVTHGEVLAAPLGQCRHIPRNIIEMIAVGEESNNLEKVLVDIADSLEKQTTRQLDLLVRLLEPVMLLVMAGVTLVVVAGLLLPVFKMGSTVG